MFKNIFLLTVVQTTNYIFPLLLLPFLVRVLGPQEYGILMLAQAIIQYFLIVVDYGFNFSSTKKIALASSQEEINTVYTNTINARILLFMIGMLIIISVFSAFDMTKIPAALVYISILSVVGNVLFPVYLFQGLEKMKDIVWISILSKFLMLASTFLLVKDKNGLNIAAFCLTLQYLLPGLISIFYVKHKKIASYLGFSLRSAVHELKHGSAIFISQMATTFYTTFNTFLLGYFYPAALVGQYAAADKMRMAAQSLLNPVQQVVFPRVNKERKSIYKKILKYSLLMLLPALAMSMVSLIIGKQVALWYLGSEYVLASKLFVVMMLLLPIISLAVVFGQWGLIVIGREKTLTKIYCTAAVIHVLYSVILVHKYSAYGMVFSVLLTEFIVTLLIIVAFIRHRSSYEKAQSLIP